MSITTHCFGCTKKFTDDNPMTFDHIIPQAIGGRLEVPLCADCHHQKIYPVDVSVTKQLHHIATLLNIKREDKKDNRPFKVTQIETGEKFYIDGHTCRREHPKIKEEIRDAFVLLDITASSEKELQSIFETKKRRIAKRHGIVIPKMETSITNHSTLGEVEHDNTIGGRLFMRGIAKMAFMFLADNFPKERILSNVFTPVRDFVFEDRGKSLTSYNFIHTKFMVDRERAVHRITIHLDSQRRNIVAYVQIFSFLRFSIVLADKYPWEIIMSDLNYGINSITGNELTFNQHKLCPDVTIQETLSPIQSQRLVYEEVENGFKRLLKYYCEPVDHPTVEFLNP